MENIIAFILVVRRMYLQVIWGIALMVTLVSVFWVLIKGRNIKTNQKFSIILSIFLVAVSIVTYTTIESQTSVNTRADMQLVPFDIQIKQTNPTAVSITWNTLKPDLQYIQLSDKSGQTVLGIDVNGLKAVSKHQVIFNTLTPGKTYFVTIHYSHGYMTMFDGQNIQFTLME